VNDLVLGIDGRNLYAATPRGVWRLPLASAGETEQVGPASGGETDQVGPAPGGETDQVGPASGGETDQLGPAAAK
jgi:hypothetical protein